MSNNNSMVTNCTSMIPKCERGYTNLGEQCVKITANDNNISSNSMIFEQSRYDIDNLNQFKTSTTENTNVIECVRNCSNSNDCDGVKFEYGNNQNEGISNNSGNINSEINYSGTCHTLSGNIKPKIINTNNYKINLPVGSSENPDTYSNASIYLKDGNVENPDSLIIKNIDQDKNIKIDLNSIVETDSLVTRVQSDTDGAECRTYVNDNYENLEKQESSDSNVSSLIQDMTSYCQANPNLQVCSDYCNRSQNCEDNVKSITILFIILTSVCLFALLFFWEKKYYQDKPKIRYTIFYILLILSLVFLGLFLYYFFLYKDTPYVGKDADIDTNLFDTTCDNYENVYNSCNSPSNDKACFKGPYETTTFLKKKPTVTLFGECKDQTPPRKEITENNIEYIKPVVYAKDGYDDIYINNENNSYILEPNYGRLVLKNPYNNDCVGANVSPGVGCMETGLKLDDASPSGYAGLFDKRTDNHTGSRSAKFDGVGSGNKNYCYKKTDRQFCYLIGNWHKDNKGNSYKGSSGGSGPLDTYCVNRFGGDNTSNIYSNSLQTINFPYEEDNANVGWVGNPYNLACSKNGSDWGNIKNYREDRIISPYISKQKSASADCGSDYCNGNGVCNKVYFNSKGEVLEEGKNYCKCMRGNNNTDTTDGFFGDKCQATCNKDCRYKGDNKFATGGYNHNSSTTSGSDFTLNTPSSKQKPVGYGISAAINGVCEVPGPSSNTCSVNDGKKMLNGTCYSKCPNTLDIKSLLGGQSCWDDNINITYRAKSDNVYYYTNEPKPCSNKNAVVFHNPINPETGDPAMGYTNAPIQSKN